MRWHYIQDYGRMMALSQMISLIIGWDNVNYVTAEMKNPSRDLSRVIHSAEPLVISSLLLYLNSK